MVRAKFFFPPEAQPVICHDELTKVPAVGENIAAMTKWGQYCKLAVVLTGTLKDLTAYDFTACGLRIADHGLRLTAYGLRLTAYDLRLTAYGLRLMAYGLRPTA